MRRFMFWIPSWMRRSDRQQALLQAAADEGLRVTPVVSLLSDFSVEPIFEDATVYVLDSKLDAAFRSATGSASGCSRRGIESHSRREPAFRLFGRTYLRRCDGLCFGFQAGCGVRSAELRYRSSSTTAFFPRDAMDQRIPSAPGSSAHDEWLFPGTQRQGRDIGAEHELNCQSRYNRLHVQRGVESNHQYR